jgi:hypothetical protein
MTDSETIALRKTVNGGQRIVDESSGDLARQ